LIDELTVILSESLGVSPEDINLVVDMETGEVTYTISTPGFESTQAVLDLLNDEETILESLNSQSDIITISSIDADDEIVANVTLVVDADEVTVDPLQIGENTVHSILGEEYETSTELNYVTSAPTFIPTVSPSKAPSTEIPSALPTITGSVVFVELTTQVYSSMPPEEVQDIISIAEQEFGLMPGNVEAEVTYEIYGTLDVTIEGDYDEEELIETLKTALAESLNIHESDVEITIDPETGVISYTISSSTAEDGLELQDSLALVDTTADISERVTAAMPNISSIDIDQDYGVFANIELIVDTTNTPDIDASMASFENVMTETYGDFDVSQESVYITAAPTYMPSVLPTMGPTTLVPTAAPTITGLVITVGATKVVTEGLTEEDIAVSNTKLDLR
jgi:hypothetical protein